jgi:hypothetical protein
MLCGCMSVDAFISALNSTFQIDYLCDTCNKHRNCNETVPDPCAATNCTLFYLQNQALIDRNARLNGACNNIQWLSPYPGQPPQLCKPYDCTGSNCYRADCTAEWNQALPSAPQVMPFRSEQEMEAYVADAGYDTVKPVIAVGVVFAHEPGLEVGANHKYHPVLLLLRALL